jgi:hypothetical protein
MELFALILQSQFIKNLSLIMQFIKNLSNYINQISTPSFGYPQKRIEVRGPLAYLSVLIQQTVN